MELTIPLVAEGERLLPGNQITFPRTAISVEKIMEIQGRKDLNTTGAVWLFRMFANLMKMWNILLSICILVLSLVG